MFDDPIPQLDTELVDLPSTDKLGIEKTSIHKQRILLLYGSTRERSFSRLLVEDKAQIDWVPLAMGAVRPTQGKTLAEGLYGIRRQRPDEAFSVLRPCR